MEFKTPLDVSIAEKLLKFPQLGKEMDDTWNFRLTAEFHMTNDSGLFKSGSGVGRLPLYEGKFIHQFTHKWAEPIRFYVNEKEGRRAIMGRGAADTGQKLAYQTYRLGIRAIGRTTDSRTLIVGPLPKNTFCGNSILVLGPSGSSTRVLTDAEVVLVEALLNSMTVDYYIRQMVSANLNMFFIYQLPVPRLTESDPRFWPIVTRAARLICTTPEFDDLAKEVGLDSHKDGTTDPDERAVLRAELDGLIAHVYGLTEEDFAYILTTFPLVEQPVKDAAMAAYREFAPKSADERIAALLVGGENATVEFKSSARWDMRENRPNKTLEQVIVKTVAAFLNTEGGTLCIGVDDSGKPVGLAHDFKTLGKKQDRDGYENWLTTLLLSAFGKEKSACIQLAFHSLEGKEICVVSVKPFPSPVYVKEDNAENLYIRTGNSTRPLTSREAVAYVKQHWA